MATCKGEEQEGLFCGRSVANATAPRY